MIGASSVLPFDRRETAEDRDARVRQDVVHSLREALENAGSGLRNVPVFLKEAFEHQVWRHERIFSGGTRQQPIGFHDFVHAPYPVGLGANYDVIRGFIQQDTQLLGMFDAASQRNVGTNQHSEGVDNINSHDAVPGRATGTSAQQGIRRLRKAAEGKYDPETGEIIEAPDEKAADLLARVMDATSEMSVNKACVEMGWRPKTATVRVDQIADEAVKRAGPMETAMRAWRKMTMEDQEQFLDWAGRNMKTVADAGRATGTR